MCKKPTDRHVTQHLPAADIRTLANPIYNRHSILLHFVSNLLDKQEVGAKSSELSRVRTAVHTCKLMVETVDENVAGNLSDFIIAWPSGEARFYIVFHSATHINSKARDTIPSGAVIIAHENLWSTAHIVLTKFWVCNRLNTANVTNAQN